MDKKKISDEKLNRIIKYLVIILLSMGTLFIAMQFSDFWSWIFAAFRSVIIPIGIAYIFALILFPLIRYLEKKGIGPRGFSLGLVFVFTVGLIFAAFYFLIPLITNEIQNFFEFEFQNIVDYITTDLRDDFIFGQNIYDQISNYIIQSNVLQDTLESFIPGFISGISHWILPLITSIALLPILLLYYLYDYELIGDHIRGIIPKKHEKRVSKLTTRLNETVGAYLRGQLMLMIALGSVATIVYKLIGLKYYFVFGLLAGITNIIPYFGLIIAALPPIIYSMLATSGPGPLLIIMVNFVLQFIEGNIFQPLIMSHQLSIHPILIIVSILFFGSLFGAIGVIFASPIAASIRVFYQFFRDLRKEKNENNLSEAKGT
ncbi:MAG: AI-2E family transporter [Tenericutes bacterium]|jgi:predicted PurR-regulated permease PerM|nr:AI-2E family transporter [Mycoplasmatota bacterium]